MQPTARAALLAHGNARRDRASLAHPQHSHQQQSAAGGTAAHVTQQRQQWDARLASFQRGLDHVVRCDAGDACGSSLCHATKRLMRSYATHDCTNPPGFSTATTSATTTANPNECKVCKLWGYILTKNKGTTTASSRTALGGWHSPTLRALSSPSSPPPVLPPLSCGLAHARAHGGGAFGGIGGIGGIARDAYRVRSMPLPSRRRVVITPEIVKAMAKRV